MPSAAVKVILGSGSFTQTVVAPAIVAVGIGATVTCFVIWALIQPGVVMVENVTV